jgi:hypothetical protein
MSCNYKRFNCSHTKLDEDAPHGWEADSVEAKLPNSDTGSLVSIGAS